MKPITPKEVEKIRPEHIPSEVIKVFNELIVAGWLTDKSIVYQQNVLDKLHDVGFKSEEIFKKNYLNIEDIYRKAGWRVYYNKPAWGEDYDPYFTFEKKLI